MELRIDDVYCGGKKVVQALDFFFLIAVWVANIDIGIKYFNVKQLLLFRKKKKTCSDRLSQFETQNERCEMCKM